MKSYFYTIILLLGTTKSIFAMNDMPDGNNEIPGEASSPSDHELTENELTEEGKNPLSLDDLAFLQQFVPLELANQLWHK